MPSWRDLYVEWKARRAGRRGIDTSIRRAARDVTGPTGGVFSASFEKLDQHGDAYMKSFDRRIPPSIFVSERDRQRHNQPMPLAERCIENHPESAAHFLDGSPTVADALAAAEAARSAATADPSDAPEQPPSPLTS